MKDHTTTPTAELLAEWGKIKKDDLVIEDVCLRWNAIAAELDRRCDDAGIAIYENQFVYNTTEFWITHSRFLEHDIMALAANGNMSAKEQHDLEAWLLMKGGNG